MITTHEHTWWLPSCCQSKRWRLTCTRCCCCCWCVAVATCISSPALKLELVAWRLSHAIASGSRVSGRRLRERYVVGDGVADVKVVRRMTCVFVWRASRFFTTTKMENNNNYYTDEAKTSSVCKYNAQSYYFTCRPTWIHCCILPNYDFCISQGSVASVLKGSGQNYSHLRQFFLDVSCQKLFKKNKSDLFWDTV